MSARLSILTGVEPQPAAGEVEHLEGVVGAFGVTVEYGVPLASRACSIHAQQQDLTQSSTP